MVSETIKQAQRMHRKAIEATYDGTCRIYGMQSVKDPVTKVTRQEETLVQDGIACHLSYSSTALAAGYGYGCGTDHQVVSGTGACGSPRQPD